MVAFVATTNLERAEAFYVGVLGLTVEEQSPFAVVLRGGGTQLRVTLVESFNPHPFTVLGWQVSGIEAVARQLANAGVTFQRYDGMQQDEQGVWRAPDGTKIMWFKDPDGNVLSLQDVTPGGGSHTTAGDLPA